MFCPRGRWSRFGRPCSCYTSATIINVTGLELTQDAHCAPPHQWVPFPQGPYTHPQITTDRLCTHILQTLRHRPLLVPWLLKAEAAAPTTPVPRDLWVRTRHAAQTRCADALCASQPLNLTVRVRIVSEIRLRSSYVLKTFRVGLIGRQNPDPFAIICPVQPKSVSFAPS